MAPRLYVDEIVSIEEIGERETVDIEVSGNNLFFVNDILTHNSGMNSTSFDLTEVSDSAGTSFTADFMIGIASSEEMEKLGHLKFIQLKNRFGPMTPKSFMVGVNRAKMTLFDLDDSFNESAYETPAKPVNTNKPSAKPQKNTRDIQF